MRGFPDAVPSPSLADSNQRALAVRWQPRLGGARRLCLLPQPEQALSIQGLLGKELKYEAGDFPTASESSSVHVRCTAVTAAKRLG